MLNGEWSDNRRSILRLASSFRMLLMPPWGFVFWSMASSFSSFSPNHLFVSKLTGFFGPNRLRRGPSLQCPTKVSSVCLSAALLFVYNVSVPQSGT